MSSYDTVTNSYPFVAAIFSEKHRQAICSGTLISRQVVITAARCFANIGSPERDLSVRLKQSNTANKSTNPVSHDVEKILIHPEFTMSSRGYKNDLALIFLKEPTQLSPIKMNRDMSLPLIGSVQKVTGWGMLDENAILHSDFPLLEGYLPVVDRQTCAKLNRAFDIDDTHICAGYVDRELISTCQGEVGGPLFSALGEPVLFGIVSDGNGCSRINLPGIYTKISSFTNWIEQSLGERGGLL